MIFRKVGKASPFMFIGVIALVFFTVIFGLQYAVYKLTYDVVTNAYINDKERVVTKSGEDVSSKYMIFTDKGTFENTDYLITFKFNSSDVYGYIKRGEYCTFEVVGWRIPFLSMYQNILTAKCSKEPVDTDRYNYEGVQTYSP